MRERSVRVMSPGTYVTNEFQAAIFAWPCVLPTAFPCSGGYHLERGVMSLHDVVGINCQKGVTNENQGADVKYIGYVDDNVCVI